MSTLFDVKLESVGEFALGEEVRIRFTLTNKTQDDYDILTWYTPLEGMLSNCLRVEHEGTAIPYDGVMMKRGKPPAEAYMLLPAGESVQEEFALHEGYRLSRLGSYTLTLQADTHDHAIRREGGLEGLLAEAREPAPVALERVGHTFSLGEGKHPRLPLGVRARAREAATAGLFEGRAFAEAVEGRAKDAQIVGGSDEGREETQAAYHAAYAYLQTSLAKLEERDPLYVTWFGEHSNLRMARVAQNYKTLKETMERKAFTLDLSGEGCRPGIFAYTYHGASTMWLCSAYWRAERRGDDSKAGTIVHELSHAICYTEDHHYGHAECKRLAHTQPNQAIQNADNYEYFSEQSDPVEAHVTEGHVPAEEHASETHAPEEVDASPEPHTPTGEEYGEAYASEAHAPAEGEELAEAHTPVEDEEW